MLDPERLVFIDETAVSTAMDRAYGRSDRGQRCVAGVPRGHWRTTTLVSGLRSNGITAPMVCDGALNGSLFRVYIEHMLVPRLNPGDVVIMDNLAAHKCAGVQDALRQAGAYSLFLPPYSPDLNPIEMAFAKLKTWLRQHKARSREALHEALAEVLATLTPKECRNMFQHAGYT